MFRVYMLKTPGAFSDYIVNRGEKDQPSEWVENKSIELSVHWNRERADVGCNS